MWPAPSSAARTTATWPSIIPLGPTTSTPAAAWATRHLGVHLERGVVVDRAPRRSSTPQWPWSVNSSRHRSAITGSASPTSATTSAIATLRMPVGVDGSAAAGVLGLRHAEEHDPAEPELGRLGGGLRSESRVCWTTPGMLLIGTGSVAPSRTNTGSTSCAPPGWSPRPARAAPACAAAAAAGPPAGSVDQRHFEPVALRRLAGRRSDGLVTGWPDSSSAAGARRRSRRARRRAPRPTATARGRRPAGRAPRRSSPWPGRSPR